MCHYAWPARGYNCVTCASPACSTTAISTFSAGFIHHEDKCAHDSNRCSSQCVLEDWTAAQEVWSNLLGKPPGRLRTQLCTRASPYMIPNHQQSDQYCLMYMSRGQSQKHLHSARPTMSHVHATGIANAAPTAWHTDSMSIMTDNLCCGICIQPFLPSQPFPWADTGIQGHLAAVAQV